MGGFLMMIGGLIVMWPQAERRRPAGGIRRGDVTAKADDRPSSPAQYDVAPRVSCPRRRNVGRGAGRSRGAVSAQQRGMMHDSSIVRDTTNLFAMDQSAARPVRLPPKPGATPVLTTAQRDELEHHLHCQCGCTLDVFTCRTTDFSCQVSPAMHRDVMELVKGGYGAQEIIDAFVATYGERALMAPNEVRLQPRSPGSRPEWPCSWAASRSSR